MKLHLIGNARLLIVSWWPGYPHLRVYWGDSPETSDWTRFIVNSSWATKCRLWIVFSQRFQDCRLNTPSKAAQAHILHRHEQSEGNLNSNLSASVEFACRFNTVGVSDAISMGTDGMSFSLQSRDLIADSVETVMGGQWYDANISIPGCDKNMPGVIIAMGRLNRPSIMIYGRNYQARLLQAYRSAYWHCLCLPKFRWVFFIVNIYQLKYQCFSFSSQIPLSMPTDLRILRHSLFMLARLGMALNLFLSYCSELSQSALQGQREDWCNSRNHLLEFDCFCYLHWINFA